MVRSFYRHRTSCKFNYVNRWIKYLLCITNFFFMMAGGMLFILGVIAFAESAIITQKSTISLLQWLFNLTVIVIGVGFITMCVAFTGFTGSLRENQCLLKFYYISLALLFVFETIIGIFFFVYRETAINRAEELVKKTFISQYREIGFEDSTSFVDFIQVELQCCGPKSYMDWTENRYFSCNATNISSEACGVPFSCCRRMNNINLKTKADLYLIYVLRDTVETSSC
uniref:Tetraspanin n=1 Tax=Mesocestoides corti TaxID=53468 RepID=A0A5K3EU08_MESCO